MPIEYRSHRKGREGRKEEFRQNHGSDGIGVRDEPLSKRDHLHLLGWHKLVTRLQTVRLSFFLCSYLRVLGVLRGEVMVPGPPAEPSPFRSQAKGLFVLTLADGTVERFRDRPARQLMVEPDAETRRDAPGAQTRPADVRLPLPRGAGDDLSERKPGSFAGENRRRIE